MAEVKIIQDVRPKFNKLSFSGYQKTQLIKTFIQLVISQQDMDETLFYAFEMLASDMVFELWNTIMLLMSKHIHIHNPLLPVYIKKKFGEFRDIVNECGVSDIDLRNVDGVRHIIGSIVILLFRSRKIVMLKDISKNMVTDGDELTRAVKANNTTYIHYIYKENDPPEFFIAFNELMYHFMVTQNSSSIHFWIDWIIHADVRCKTKKKRAIICHLREDVVQFVDGSMHAKQNIVWVIWDAIFYMLKHECARHNEPKDIESNKQTETIIDSLFKLFTIRYSVSMNRKRIHLIYHAIEVLLLRDQIDFKIPLIDDKTCISQLSELIDIAIRRIKSKEVRHLSLEELKQYEKKPRKPRKPKTNQAAELSTEDLLAGRF